MYWDKLTAEQLSALYAQFNTTEEIIKNDVQFLIQWMESQPHLPNVKDEYFLTNILLQCKNSLETAKGQIDAYYSARATMKELFTDRDPSEPVFHSITRNIGCPIPLPRLTPNGYRIVCLRIFEHSSSDVPTRENLLKWFFIMVDLLMKDDRNCGLIIISDHKNMSFALTAVYLMNMSSLFTIFIKILKFRLKNIYIVSSNSLTESIDNLIIKLLPKKLSERVIIWNKDPKDMIQVLPKEVLPSEYGGNLKSLKELSEDFVSYVCEFQEWFRNEDDVKADLSKKLHNREVESDVASHGIEAMYWDKLTVEQLSALYAQFNTTEEMLKNDVQTLIQWMESQPHLPNVKDDYFLTNILLQCKNSLERAKGLVDAYYSARATMKELFTDRDPSEPVFHSSTTNIGCPIPLPRLTPNGYRIVCIPIFEHSSSDVPTKENILKWFFIMVDLLMKDDRNCGLTIILDHKNLSFALTTVYLMSMSSIFTIFIKILKFRLNNVYIVNSNSLTASINNLMIKLLPKKLSERVIIWNKDPKDMIQVLPKEVLPSEYGGNLKSLKELSEDFVSYVCEFQEWFRNEDDVKADLSKKLHNREVECDVASHGIEGSFRQLDVD